MLPIAHSGILECLSMRKIGRNHILPRTAESAQSLILSQRIQIECSTRVDRSFVSNVWTPIRGTLETVAIVPILQAPTRARLEFTSVRGVGIANRFNEIHVRQIVAALIDIFVLKWYA